VCLLGSERDGSVFVYRWPIPRQRRAGNCEHVEGGLVEVISAVEDKKWNGKDDDKRGYLLDDRDW